MKSPTWCARRSRPWWAIWRWWFPCVVLISAALWFTLGQPMIDAKEAEHVLHSLTLLGPDRAVCRADRRAAVCVQHHRRLGRELVCAAPAGLGAALQPPASPRVWATARAERWAQFMRDNISGLAANVSLGLMLGLVRLLPRSSAWGWKCATSPCPPDNWPRRPPAWAWQVLAATRLLVVRGRHCCSSARSTWASAFTWPFGSLCAPTTSAASTAPASAAPFGARWRHAPLSFFWPAKETSPRRQQTIRHD